MNKTRQKVLTPSYLLGKVQISVTSFSNYIGTGPLNPSSTVSSKHGCPTHSCNYLTQRRRDTDQIPLHHKPKDTVKVNRSSSVYKAWYH